MWDISPIFAVINNLKTTIMARPIAPTPTLRGIEALRFMEKMDNVQPVSKERKEEMKRNYELAKSRATFPL